MVGNRGVVALIIAAGLFAVFLANVIAGAAGLGSFLPDVGEMLMLFCASAFFVAAILQLEKSNTNGHPAKLGGSPQSGGNIDGKTEG